MLKSQREGAAAMRLLKRTVFEKSVTDLTCARVWSPPTKVLQAA
jgi:hypothetical protein